MKLIQLLKELEINNPTNLIDMYKSDIDLEISKWKAEGYIHPLEEDPDMNDLYARIYHILQIKHPGFLRANMKQTNKFYDDLDKYLEINF